MLKALFEGGWVHREVNNCAWDRADRSKGVRAGVIGAGGRSGVGREDDSPREKSFPPVEAESSSGLCAVVGELLPGLRLRVDDRVEMQVRRPGLSSELETELIAQSVSLSGEKLQSLFRRCRVELRLVRDPQVAEEVEGWSGSISGVRDRRYSGFRKSEAL